MKKTQLATEVESAVESTGLMIWRLTNSWQAAQRAALAPLGLTHVQFVLLASLVWLDSDVPVTQKLLAAHAHTDSMMTSQVMRALEQKGLVERRSHPSDNRARHLVPTRRGFALANQAVVLVEQVDARFFGVLGEQRSTFTQMIRRVLDAQHMNDWQSRPEDDLD